MDKTNFLFGTLTFGYWEILATWIHVGAPQKNKKNKFTTYFE
jgi:hypothetical protein